MLQLLPEARAKEALLHLASLICGRGTFDEEGLHLIEGRTLMLGALTCRLADGAEKTIYAFSGALDGDYLVPGYVPPCFSVKAFREITAIYDGPLHSLPDGEERRQLSNECLARLRELYVFHSPYGKLGFKDMGIESMPTGTGDCAAIKLLSYCFKRSWEPVSLCELHFGTSPSHGHLESRTPCDERCGLILPHMLGLRICYSDDDIIIVDKEAGMLSVPGRGEDKQDCVATRLRRIFPSIPAQPSVHRLDMDTSGVMVWAKTPQAQRKLSMAFEARQVSKSYTALVEGLVKEDGGQVDLPIRLDVDNRPCQIVDPVDGKKAVTEWKRLGVEVLDGRTVTRIAFHPRTGRTHQIRVHAASGLGHPIVGDRLYGTRKEGERLCLHATTISFTHPGTGEEVTFSTPVPF